MSVIAHLIDPPVTLIDHKKYLIDLYKDIKYVPKEIFSIKTPFRMDLEAEKVAETITEGDLTNDKIIKRNRKKRKKLLDHDQNDELSTIESLTKSLIAIKSKCPSYFEEPPNPQTIRENNKPVRLLVKELSRFSSSFTCQIKNENNDADSNKIIEIKGK